LRSNEEELRDDGDDSGPKLAYLPPRIPPPL